EMTPQQSAHATAIGKTAAALRRAFGAGYFDRLQLPLALGPGSEPEPDVAIAPGEPDDYADEHPKSALLVVEVSDKTLRYDRTRKASLYAKAGIRDYWVLDLVHRRLEIRREPEPAPEEPFGYGYGVVNTYGPSDVVSCLAAPDHPILVADLLPRVQAPAAEEAKPKRRGRGNRTRKERS